MGILEPTVITEYNRPQAAQRPVVSDRSIDLCRLEVAVIAFQIIFSADESIQQQSIILTLESALDSSDFLAL